MVWLSAHSMMSFRQSLDSWICLPSDVVNGIWHTTNTKSVANTSLESTLLRSFQASKTENSESAADPVFCWRTLTQTQCTIRPVQVLTVTTHRSLIHHNPITGTFPRWKQTASFSPTSGEFNMDTKSQVDIQMKIISYRAKMLVWVFLVLKYCFEMKKMYWMLCHRWEWTQTFNFSLQLPFLMPDTMYRHLRLTPSTPHLNKAVQIKDQ